MFQNTIKKEVSISGIGLHTGKEVSIRFKPAEIGTGIVFVRIDKPGRPRVKANLNNVSSTERGTSLGKVYTVEHVLSALHALSVTNCEIELDGPEPPAIDGSSREYCNLMKRAGVISQNADLKKINLRSPVIVRDKDGCVVALPSDRLVVSFMINYPFDFIGSQFYRFDLNSKKYIKWIAPARTYGFLSEVPTLRRRRLAGGASFKNTVVLGKDHYLTKLRFKDELVRHKILDLIGDLSLLGAEINAHIICIKSGHKLNIKLAKLLLRQAQHK